MPFCSVLHNHVCVRLPGNYATCCYWNKDYTRFSDNPNKYFTSIDKSYNNYYNSELHQEIIQVMNVDGSWHPGCQKCKNLEDAGLESIRTNVNKNLPSDGIRFMQISLSNHCNFACKTCDSRSSSTIKKMVDVDPRLRQWFFQSNLTTDIDVYKMFNEVDLSNLEMIELLGGEPFVDPQTEHFLNYLTSTLENIKLKVHTNTSFFPKKLVPLLAKIKDIELHLSIDAWHPSIEYCRLGSNFDVIKSVTQKWIDFAKQYNNTTITMFPAVSVFNVCYLKDTIKAAEQLNIDFDYVIVEHPKHLNINALPEQYVSSIKNKYNEKFFKAYKHDAEQFSVLKDFIKDTDGAQGKFLKDYIPDLAKYIEGE